MKKMLLLLCISLYVFSFTSCQDTQKEQTNGTQSEVTVVSTPVPTAAKDSTTGISEDKPFYNEELQRYEIVDGFSDAFMEIMGEKITLNGTEYQDISSRLHERIMFNAVRFYIAAASADNTTLKKLADKELLNEIEKSLSKTGDGSFKLGGDVITSFKDISMYKKPVSITPPKKINENDYIVTMEYNNKDKRQFVDVTLSIATGTVKIRSFLIKQ